MFISDRDLEFFDNLQYMALIEEPDATIKYANQTFCDFYNLTKEEIVGKNLFDFLIPEDKNACNAEFLVTPEKPEYRLEGRTYDKKGNLVWLQFVGKGFFNTEGKLIEFQEIAVDISDWKEQIENEVRKMSRVRTNLMDETDELIVPEARINATGANAGNIAKYSFEDIVTRNQAMLVLIKQARYVSESNSSILIEGESGTGKELLAQAIHNASKRRNGPFVAVNCGAIAPDLLQSELFGYVRGAFTGADRDGKIGKFELANDGTLFLDEIAEMPKNQQTALLRALESKTITRVGDNRVIPINARIICATNKDLFREVCTGSFRNDLYFRLNVINLRIPPLRDRKEDIYPLIVNMLESMGKVIGKDLTISDEEMKILYSSKWPGNVRELRNILERMLYMPDYDLEQILRSEIYLDSINANASQCVEDGILQKPQSEFVLAPKLSEKAAIEATLKETGGNVAMAARKLGISRKTIYRRLKQYDISVKRQ